MIKLTECSICKRDIEHGEKVSVLILDVEVYNKSSDNQRLKLSEDSIEKRACKIFCKRCIDISQYITQE